MGGSVAEAPGVITCTCGARAGFTCVNGWWLCAICCLPRKMYLQSVLSNPAAHGKENEVGLIYFQGGPLDGTAYDTRAMLGTASLSIPVNEYVWTPEKKTSERTGDVAQIWRHESLVAGVTSSKTNGYAAVSPPGGGGVTAQQVAAAEKTSVGSATATQVQQIPQQSPTGAAFHEAAAAVQEYEQTQTAPTAASATTDTATSDNAAPVLSETLVVSSSDLPTGDELLERRKALKLSVGAVVEAAGHQLAHSKIGAIEKGVGKRVKPEEVRILADTIARLEAERGGAGARS